MKKNKQLDFRRKAFVRKVLRRASLRWEARNVAIKLARLDRGVYLCNICKQAFRRNEIQLDHIEPVVPLDDANPSMDQYIERLLPDYDGFQVICTSCHDIKTQQENLIREIKKKTKKKRSKKLIKT